MTPPQWTRRLLVGIPEIDRQHRELVELINRISDRIAAGDEQEVVTALIEQLERDTEVHFAAEERLMDAHAYHDSAAHKAEHREMLADIHRYCDECVLGRGNPKVVLGYLEHWFMRHIADADRRFGAAMAAA